MKSLVKRFFKSPVGPWVAAILAFIYSLLVWFSSKVRIQNDHFPQQFWDEKQPVIIAVWHGRLLLSGFPIRRKSKTTVIASANPDGQIAAHLANLFGMKAVAGSSGKHGARAFLQLLRHAKNGRNLVITPDGPRGPRMHLAPGVTDLAQKTGLPVLPLAISCTNPKFAKSWDKFMVPKPFNEIIMRWDAPLTLPRDASDSEKQAFATHLEQVMVALQRQVDEDAGITPIEPAELTGTKEG